MYVELSIICVHLSNIYLRYFIYRWAGAHSAFKNGTAPGDFRLQVFLWISFPQTAGVVDTVVDLDLQISPVIFEKIRKDHNVIFRGKMNPEKT
jgi:hypothetical protein